MSSKFQRGDIVMMKSGGPPMTVDKAVGEPTTYGGPLTEYHCEWFKGATAQQGSFAEHLLIAYEPPKK